ADQVEMPFDVDVVRDVVLDEDEVTPGEMLYVGRIARDEVVHADDGVITVEEVLAEMRSDEPGCPGHEGSRFHDIWTRDILGGRAVRGESRGANMRASGRTP